MPTDNEPSCPSHPTAPAHGCEPCRIVQNDILSCDKHPEGGVDGCAECEAITEVWADFFVGYSRRLASSVA